MPIAFSCSGCAKRYEVSDALAGKTGRCKQCGTTFKVPVPRHLATPPAASPSGLTLPPVVPQSRPTYVANEDVFPTPAPSQPRPAAPARPAPPPARPRAPASSLDDFDDDEMLDEIPLADSRGAKSSRSRASDHLDDFDDDEAEDADSPPFAAAAPRKAKKKSKSSGGFALPSAMSLPMLIFTVGGVLHLGFLAFVVWPSMQGGGNAAAAVAQAAGAAAPVGLANNPMPGAAGGAASPPAVGGFPVLPPPGPDLLVPGRAPAPVGDIGAHEALLRTLIDLLGRQANILATIRDAPSAQAAAAQMQALEPQLRNIQAQAASMRNPSPAGEAEIARRVLGDMTAVVNRLEAEANRLAAMPGGLAGQMNFRMSLANFRGQLQKMEASMHAVDKPFVEVYVTNVPDDASHRLIRSKLEALADAPQGRGSQGAWGGGTRSASYRIWPVANPGAFAGRIDFGTANVSAGRIEVAAFSIDPNELASAAETPERPDPAVAARRPGRSQDPQPPADADEVTRALFLLKSSAWPRQLEGLQKLTRMLPVDDRRDEVVAAVEPFVSADHTTNRDAVKALANWINPRAEEILTHVIRNNDDVFVRREAIEQAGRLGLASTAEALASRLADDWTTAPKALKAIGPEAESAVIPLLRSDDEQARRAACEILRDIGGKETLDTMKTLPADPNPLVQMRAREAMQAISDRLRASGVDPGTPKAPRPKSGRFRN